MVLTPAYGRDYKSGKAAIADLESQKDFCLCDGPRSTYINLQQMQVGDVLEIRFKRLTELVVYTVKK